MRKNLMKARKNAKLSVADMALRFNISQSFYYKIEAGARNPTINLANEMALYLGKTVDYLFFDNQLDDSSNGETSATRDTA